MQFVKIMVKLQENIVIILYDLKQKQSKKHCKPNVDILDIYRKSTVNGELCTIIKYPVKSSFHSQTVVLVNFPQWDQVHVSVLSLYDLFLLRCSSDYRSF